MPEFRQNLATKEWIIIAAERAKRPEDFARSRPPAKELPAQSPDCPFCPGQERMTPDAILTLPHTQKPEQWDVRVVPNKFPALVSSPGDGCHSCSTHVGPYLRREGVGHHEVVIETPLHNRDIPLLSPHHMEHVMQAYRQRYNSLIQYPSTELVVIFRNHGTKAGTSLIHPHSQIVASSVVPFPVRNRLYEGQRYFDMYGRCVYCDIIDYETREGGRVIMDNEHFIAIAPYASGVPYEVWLLPKHHRATFGTVELDEIADLAHVLQNALTRLWRLLDDPDYNYVIDTAPEHMAEVPFYHWHLEIYPKLTTQAGFEIGSGIGINIVTPEAAAEQLRNTDGSPLTIDETSGLIADE
ncbi:MAG TPA: galactose-1-phosphate uridylyltransferase [Armatimonadota bacterium]|nr:galactose-1-phosphate uridylyltransferase [Armatimonadota bacterium]